MESQPLVHQQLLLYALTYYPFDENYFYSLPAAHIAGKMANDTDQPASRAIGLAMIDLMREQRGRYGFIPLSGPGAGSRRIHSIGPATTTARFNGFLAGEHQRSRKLRCDRLAGQDP